MHKVSPPTQHGGRLRAAAHRYGIPTRHWLDLSTGINPLGWPVPPVPEDVWRRLPEDDDGLAMASLAYFGGARVLPVAGSQAALQAIPLLFSMRRVGIVSPCYSEHARAWQAAGHDVREFAIDEVDAALATLDALVLTNPNNPTGVALPSARLREWHSALAARGGLLVVDEAFIEAGNEPSLVGQNMPAGLIVLRSLGKFFGLAGVRCGFVAAHPSLLAWLAEQMGPWAVSHPARWVAQRALADGAWQREAAQRLQRDGARLAALLAARDLHSPSGCGLFRWVPTPRAGELFEAFARKAILVRAFPQQAGLRFGLPGTQAEWHKLEQALAETMG